MIKKIVSGGQTGADLAALDSAISWDIPHGGWIPKGRKTEQGTLPNKYQLKEMPTESYAERTEQNVIDSEGTLILSHGKLTGGSLYTMEMADKNDRPCLHINLNKTNTFKAAQVVYEWISGNQIEIINVAGPRASNDPYIYQDVTKLLVTLFHMETIETNLPDPHKAAPFMPSTVEEAVEMLISKMPLKGKSSIARMKEHDLTLLHPGMGGYIQNRFGLWVENEELLQSCRDTLKKKDIQEDEALSLIIKELWNKLRETHSLRLVR